MSKPGLIADTISKSQLPSETSICTCRRIGRQISKRSFGPFKIQRSFRDLHQPGCLYYEESARTEFETRFTILLSRLVSRSVELVYSSTNGAGGFSVTDRWVTVIEIVDGDTGPGFARFQEAITGIAIVLKTSPNLLAETPSPYRKCISTAQMKLVQQLLRTLHHELRKDFDTRVVSARVQDHAGKTLLFVRCFAELCVLCILILTVKSCSNQVMLAKGFGRSFDNPLVHTR